MSRGRSDPERVPPLETRRDGVSTGETCDSLLYVHLRDALSTETPQRLTHVVPWLSTCGANPSANPQPAFFLHGTIAALGLPDARGQSSGGAILGCRITMSNHERRLKPAVNWLSQTSNCARPSVRLCTSELRSSLQQHNRTVYRVHCDPHRNEVGRRHPVHCTRLWRGGATLLGSGLQPRRVCSWPGVPAKPSPHFEPASGRRHLSTRTPLSLWKARLPPLASHLLWDDELKQPYLPIPSSLPPTFSHVRPPPGLHSSHRRLSRCRIHESLIS